jgi:hypothetical protein
MPISKEELQRRGIRYRSGLKPGLKRHMPTLNLKIQFRLREWRDNKEV